jgi:hypothetical protein
MSLHTSVFRRGDPARQVRLGIKKLGMPSPRQNTKRNPDFSSQRLCGCPEVRGEMRDHLNLEHGSILFELKLAGDEFSAYKDLE